MHHICPTEDHTHSSITVDGKDIGITYIEYGDTVEEEPSEHCIKVPFDFGKGPALGHYKTHIMAKGATIPDGCDVVVEYGVKWQDKPLRDTLQNVRKVDEDKYVCDYVTWDGLEPVFGMRHWMSTAHMTEVFVKLQENYYRRFSYNDYMQLRKDEIDRLRQADGTVDPIALNYAVLAKMQEQLESAGPKPKEELKVLRIEAPNPTASTALPPDQGLVDLSDPKTVDSVFVSLVRPLNSGY